MKFIMIWCVNVLSGQIIRKVFDTLLSEHTHINLQTQERKDTEWEHSKNNDIT